MADQGTLDVIREALADSDRVSTARIELALDGGEVVLRGAVSTAEEATVATMMAEQHADRVRNLLRVDPALREDHTDPREVAREAAQRAADSDLDDSAAVPDRPRGEDWSAQSTQQTDVAMHQMRDDLTPDVSEALGENVPWDPPEQPHLAPTEAEQRGVTDREQEPEALAEAGADGAGTPSLPGVSAAELARDARPGEEDH